MNHPEERWQSEVRAAHQAREGEVVEGRARARHLGRRPSVARPVLGRIIIIIIIIIIIVSSSLYLAEKEPSENEKSIK